MFDLTPNCFKKVNLPHQYSGQKNTISLVKINCRSVTSTVLSKNLIEYISNYRLGRLSPRSLVAEHP